MRCPDEEKTGKSADYPHKRTFGNIIVHFKRLVKQIFIWYSIWYDLLI